MKRILSILLTRYLSLVVPFPTCDYKKRCQDGDSEVQDLDRYQFGKKLLATLMDARRSTTKLQNLRFLYKVGNYVISPINDPIFIFGSPRSGTTFLGEIMNAVPSLCYYFEPQIIKYYSRLVYEGLVSFEEAKKFYRRVFKLLMIFAPRGGNRFVEKTPRNIFIASTLYKIFPKAKFIHIIRDGRDVVCSLLKKPWYVERSKYSGKREPGGYRYGPYPHFYIEKDRRDGYRKTTDVHRCIWIWKSHVAQGLKLRKELPQNTYYEIKYESLVYNPKSVVKELLQFINEYNEDNYKEAMKVANLAFTTGIKRWQRELSEQDLNIIYQESGLILSKYNYL